VIVVHGPAVSGRPRATRIFVANAAAAFGSLAVFKIARYLEIVSQGELLSPLRLASRLPLLFGWDVMGAAAVGLVAVAASAAAGWRRRWTLSVSAAVQAGHSFFLAVSFYVIRAVGVPLDRGAINLLVNHDDAAGGGPLSGSWVWSSVEAYLTQGPLAAVAVSVLAAIVATVWLFRFFTGARHVPRTLAAIPALALTFTIVVLPLVKRGGLAGTRMRTGDLEASPGLVLAASYVRPLIRPPSPAVSSRDPFCMDFGSADASSDAAGLAAWPAAVRLKPHRTNILFVVLESVAAEVLEAARPALPFLAKLASSPQSIRFTAHYTHWAQSTPSLFSLFASEMPYPEALDGSLANPAMPVVTLSEVLKAAGYRTALFSSASIGFERQRAFFQHRGFDSLYDMRSIPGSEDAWSNTWGIDEDVTIRGLVDWIDRGRADGEPFFASYVLAAGHHPFSYPGVNRGRLSPAADSFAAYRDVLRYVDGRLAALVRALDGRDLLRETLLVVVSDHGIGSEAPGGGFVGRATVSEGAIHVPWIVHGPQIERGGAVAAPTGHIDVAPTIAGLVGVAPSLTMKGRNLARDRTARTIIAASRVPGAEIAVRDGRWKLVMAVDTGIGALYDIASDPGQSRDRAADHPELARALQRRALEWRAHSNYLMENYTDIASRFAHPCG
jgi:arylsulfatase A-like enzyme